MPMTFAEITVRLYPEEMSFVTLPLRLNALILIMLGAVLILGACAGPQAGHAPSAGYRGPASKPGPGTITPNRGVASWYGPKFHGRKTANGEVYNMYDLTAAHRTLPFGTLVQVTNVSNGLQVQVRINDRGPFIKNRIIDLSYTAARKIDMIGSGTAPVQLKKIRTPTPALPNRYFVQTGSFTQLENAEAVLARLKKKGYRESRKVRVRLDGQTYWRVQAGVFPTLASAQKNLRAMRKENPACFIIAD